MQLFHNRKQTEMEIDWKVEKKHIVYNNWKVLQNR